MALLGSVCFSLGLIIRWSGFLQDAMSEPLCSANWAGQLYEATRLLTSAQTQPCRHSPLLLRKCTSTKYSLATCLRNRAMGRSKSHSICLFSSLKNVTIYTGLWHGANYQSDVFRSSTEPHDSPVKYLLCYYYTCSWIWVGNAWVPSWIFAGQRTICRNQFLPSIMWVPRTEFRFGGKRL